VFDPKRLFELLEEIDRLNLTLSGITLLKGIEVDILQDGSLYLHDEDLCRLDLATTSTSSDKSRQSGSCVRWTIPIS
jgi:DNA polymerase (family X)